MVFLSLLVLSLIESKNLLIFIPPKLYFSIVIVYNRNIQFSTIFSQKKVNL